MWDQVFQRPGGLMILVVCTWSLGFPAVRAMQAYNSSTPPTVSPHNMPSSVTSTLTYPTTSTSQCEPVTEFLTGVRGYVTWTEDWNTSCNERRVWALYPEPDHGSVLQLHQINLTSSTSLRLHSLISSSNGSVMMEVNEKHVWKENNYSPRAIVIRGGIKLTVETTKTKALLLSSFNISYAIYQLSTLPQEVTITNTNASNMVMYNCSGNILVPREIACDGVKHCIGDEDEDEEKCKHWQGCGDWVHYHDQCLKIEAPTSIVWVPGRAVLTTPLEANQNCFEKYGATLAVLPDKLGIDLVEDMMHNNGVTLVSINLRKVKPVSKKHKHLYRYLWQWGTQGSSIAHEQLILQSKGVMLDCAVMSISPSVHIVPIRCYLTNSHFPNGYVCMIQNPKASYTYIMKSQSVHLPEATRSMHQFLTKQCVDGSIVQIFHQCQWDNRVLSTTWSPNNFPLFYCKYGPPIHYTLVCDGLDDCVDRSDETDCIFPRVLSKKNIVFCENHQVIPKNHYCNGVPDCFDETDEQDCTVCRGVQCREAGCVPYNYRQYFEKCTSIPPYIELPDIWWEPGAVRAVDLDGYGMSRVRFVRESAAILGGYFLCSNGYYMPSYLLNNGELDCPRGEDENIPPENFTCPGFYRCQQYDNCIHPDFVCDGVYHCPNKDDERYCNLPLPSNCTCEGYACSCHVLPWPLDDIWYLRYLDLSGVKKPLLAGLFVLNFLQFMNASFCQLNNVTLLNMPQLRILDLSYNALSGLSSMVMGNLTGLIHLNISGNPLVTKLDASFSAFLRHAGLVNIKHLIMTNTHVSEIEDNAYNALTYLDSLDIRSNTLGNYNKDLFDGLVSLKVLRTDDSKLCCSYFHPQELECHAPSDELSSCNDLLRLDFFRVFLWGFALLTTLGNSGVLIYKIVTRKRTKATPYQILVSHLCVADLLMGINLIIIGAADVLFRGSYVASEKNWRQSSACLVAGFLSFVSSEMSAFIICLITLDRLLKLCFPFKSHLHLTAKSSMKLCCVTWGLGVLLAAVPLIAQLEFYGESSLCLPLPITRHQFSGQMYAFLVFIVMNFLLFLFIGTGQIVIYCAIRRTKAAVKTKQQEEDNTIARRLFLVVFTDFCCWFPVGVMGLLAFYGFPIPGVVSVWVAIFVLPINSALNPFLYTLNGMREKWNIQNINHKSKRILFSLKDEIPKLAPDTIEEIMLAYLRTNRAARLEKFLQVMRTKQDGETNAGHDRNTLALNGESTCTADVDKSKTQIDAI